MRYALLFVSPAVLAVALLHRGVAFLLPVVVMFGLVPLIDAAVGIDRREGGAGRWLPVLYVPVHLGMLAWGVHVEVSGLETVGLVVALGIGTAVAINVAHELMHRPSRLESGLATVVMATALYAHFCVEHVRGHHRNVGTPLDPATARMGEPLWRFLPRTVVGSFRSAWRLDRRRVLLGLLIQVPFLALGWVFVAQAVVAVLMLETINYVEHYGLARREVAPGRYEKVEPRHSWNSGHAVSNWMLLNLARHSDHHAHVARPYSQLRHFDDVPQLPAGYSAMLLLALVPPLWFRVMDRRVQIPNGTPAACQAANSTVQAMPKTTA